MSTTKNQPPPSEIPPHLQDPHCLPSTPNVLTTTMHSVPGYKVTKVLGTVYGITVRSRNVGADLLMGLKSLAGGELRWFTNMLYQARNDAISRVVAEAQCRGGNAIIALRFDADNMGTFAQVCAYGTAAVIEKVDDGVQTAGQLVEGGKGGS